MPPDVSLLAEVLTRLQREAGTQVGVKYTSETGASGLTILPLRAEIVAIDALTTKLMLPYGLGLLTLDAQDLSAARKIPSSDAWRLDFGPLAITIEFGGST